MLCSWIVIWIPFEAWFQAFSGNPFPLRPIKWIRYRICFIQFLLWHILLIVTRIGCGIVNACKIRLRIIFLNWVLIIIVAISVLINESSIIIIIIMWSISGCWIFSVTSLQFSLWSFTPVSLGSLNTLFDSTPSCGWSMDFPSCTPAVLTSSMGMPDFVRKLRSSGWSSLVPSLLICPMTWD